MGLATTSNLFSKFHENSPLNTSESTDAIDQTPSMTYFLCDLSQGQILKVSESIYSLTGYSPEEFYKNGIHLFFSLMHPFDYTRLLEFYTTKQVYNEQQFHHDSSAFVRAQQLKLKHRDGNYISIAISCLNYLPTNRMLSGLLKYVKSFEGNANHRITSDHGNSNHVRNNKNGFKPNLVESGGNFETVEKRISLREQEVLGLIAEGYSSKMIADKLFISPHTVVNHRRNLMDKFKVKNSAELVCKASKRYWL